MKLFDRLLKALGHCLLRWGTALLRSAPAVLPGSEPEPEPELDRTAQARAIWEARVAHIPLGAWRGHGQAPDAAPLQPGRLSPDPTRALLQRLMRLPPAPAPARTEPDRPAVPAAPTLAVSDEPAWPPRVPRADAPTPAALALVDVALPVARAADGVQAAAVTPPKPKRWAERAVARVQTLRRALSSGCGPDLGDAMPARAAAEPAPSRASEAASAPRLSDPVDAVPPRLGGLAPNAPMQPPVQAPLRALPLPTRQADCALLEPDPVRPAARRASSFTRPSVAEAQFPPRAAAPSERRPSELPHPRHAEPHSLFRSPPPPIPFSVPADDDTASHRWPDLPAWPPDRLDHGLAERASAARLQRLQAEQGG